MFLYDGTYKKGMMEWDLDNSTWRFSQIHCKGTELFGLSLPEFCQTFRKYIDDGTIVCGWYGGMNFHLAGSTRHVSAVPWRVFLLLGLFQLLSITVILIIMFGLTPTKKNMMAYLKMTHLTSLAKTNIVVCLRNVTRRLSHRCVHLLLRKLTIFPLMLRVGLWF